MIVMRAPPITSKFNLGIFWMNFTNAYTHTLHIINPIITFVNLFMAL